MQQKIVFYSSSDHGLSDDRILQTFPWNLPTFSVENCGR